MRTLYTHGKFDTHSELMSLFGETDNVFGQMCATIAQARKSAHSDVLFKSDIVGGKYRPNEEALSKAQSDSRALLDSMRGSPVKATEAQDPLGNATEELSAGQ